MSDDDRAGDVQPEPEPAVARGWHRAPEPIEDERAVVRIDADAVIDHRQPRRVAGPVDADLDRFAGAELGRVADEVGHDLLEP